MNTVYRPAHAWYVVGVLALANCVSFIDRLILSLLVQPIKSELAISDTAFSLLAGAAFAIFYCGIGLVIARWADRYSRKWIVTIGITLWCLMTALSGTARSYLQLFAYRVGVGVGEATLSPSAYSLLAGHFPPQKLALAVGIFSAGVTAGTGLAYLLGGSVIGWVISLGSVELPLLGELSGWRLVMAVVGLLGLPVALLMAFVREPARPQGLPPATLTEVWAHFKAHAKEYGYVFAGYGATTITAFAVMIWTPELYRRQYGAGIGEAALVIGTVALIGGLLGAFIGGALSDRLEANGDSSAKLRDRPAAPRRARASHADDARPRRADLPDVPLRQRCHGTRWRLRAVDHARPHACAVRCLLPVLIGAGRGHARAVCGGLRHRPGVR
jgi:MFS family permease